VSPLFFGGSIYRKLETSIPDIWKVHPQREERSAD
jgi:hypothetical protein